MWQIWCCFPRHQQEEWQSDKQRVPYNGNRVCNLFCCCLSCCSCKSLFRFRCDSVFQVLTSPFILLRVLFDRKSFPEEDTEGSSVSMIAYQERRNNSFWE